MSLNIANAAGMSPGMRVAPLLRGLKVLVKFDIIDGREMNCAFLDATMRNASAVEQQHLIDLGIVGSNDGVDN